MKNLIAKTWKRCRSLGSDGGDKISMTRSKTWHSEREDRRRRKCQVAPQGCFSVLVGTERKRFAVKTEYVNHPMFRLLLEDAESEFGFCADGPIVLPCDPDLFDRVLAEMESGDEDDDVAGGPGCGVGCSPARLRPSASRCGSYGVLNTRSRMIKMNIR